MQRQGDAHFASRRGRFEQAAPDQCRQGGDGIMIAQSGHRLEFAALQFPAGEKQVVQRPQGFAADAGT